MLMSTWWKRLEFVFEFYHTRNIIKDRLGVVERKEKGEKKNKKRKKEGRKKKRENWYNDKMRKSALTYFQKKSSKMVKECWGFIGVLWCLNSCV